MLKLCLTRDSLEGKPGSCFPGSQSSWLWCPRGLPSMLTGGVQQFHGMSSQWIVAMFVISWCQGSFSGLWGGSGPHVVCQLSWMHNAHQLRSSSGGPCFALNSRGLDMRNQSSWKLQMVSLPSRLPWRQDWLPEKTGFLCQGGLCSHSRQVCGPQNLCHTWTFAGKRQQSRKKKFWRQRGLGLHSGCTVYRKWDLVYYSNPQFSHQ